MAAGGISIQMLGDVALSRKLKGLPPKLQKKIVRKAMRTAIKPVAAQIKANAPVLSGLLQLSIGVSGRKYRDRNKFGVQVATNKLSGVDIYYAAFNELGTQKQPAKPFMRPALHGNETGIKATMDMEIGQGITRAAVAG